MAHRQNAGLHLRLFRYVEPAYILFDGKGGGEANFTARPWKTSSTAC
jgi:hypothetical protein